METVIFLAPLYFGLAFLIAYFGENKKIGFDAVLLISILLTPLGGIIAVGLSQSEADDRRQREKKAKQRREYKRQQLKNAEARALELQKLDKLKSSGLVSDADFDAARRRLIRH